MEHKLNKILYNYSCGDLSKRETRELIYDLFGYNKLEEMDIVLVDDKIRAELILVDKTNNRYVVMYADKTGEEVDPKRLKRFVEIPWKEQ